MHLHFADLRLIWTKYRFYKCNRAFRRPACIPRRSLDVFRRTINPLWITGDIRWCLLFWLPVNCCPFSWSIVSSVSAKTLQIIREQQEEQRKQTRVCLSNNTLASVPQRTAARQCFLLPPWALSCHQIEVFELCLEGTSHHCNERCNKERWEMENTTKHIIPICAHCSGMCMWLCVCVCLNALQ